MFRKRKPRSKDKNTFKNFSLITNKAEIKSIFETIYHKTYKHPMVLRMERMNRRSIDI